MTKVTRKEGREVDPSAFQLWTTNSEYALRDDGLFATTQTATDELRIIGFDFSEIPSTATIAGVEVILQMKFTDNPGMGNLVFGSARLYKGGTGPSNTRRTPLLTATEQTYVLGGATDLWGLTWTPADFLEANGFAVWCIAGLKAEIAPTTWHLDYVAVSVYWNPATQVSENQPTEGLFFTETVKTSIAAVAVSERLVMSDEKVPTGTAITSWRTTPNFVNRAGNRLRREGAGVRLWFSGVTLNIGDATLMTKADNTIEPNLPMAQMEPGLIAVGEILRTGDYGEETQLETTSVVVANKLYQDQSGANLGNKLLSEWFRTVPSGSRFMHIYAFVDAGDGWQARLVFLGDIEDVEFTENRCEIHAIQLGTSNLPVPNQFVDSSSFAYEPGSTAESTGEEITANRGKVIPIGIGRFDITAIKRETAYAAGHPFRFSPGQSGVAADRKVYSNAAVFPALWGVKFPMMPTVWAAKNFRRINGQNGPLGFISLPYQHVFLHGSRNAQPQFFVDTGPSRADKYNMLCPGYDYSNVVDLFSRGNVAQALQYVTAWTWEKSTDASFGTPFLRDWTTRNASPSSGTTNEWPFYNHHGGGPMDGLGQRTKVIGQGWSDGTASQAFGAFLNGPLPGGDIGTLPTFWMPLMQCCAIPMTGVIADVNNVIAIRQNESGGPAVWPGFHTDTGTGKVENPENCIKLDAPDSFTRINAGYFLTLACPKTGPSNLGTMLGVRFCGLINTTTTTATNLIAFFKFGPRFNRGFLPAATEGEQIGDWGSNDGIITWKGKSVQCINNTIGANYPFFSFWMLPLWDNVKKNPLAAVDATRAIKRQARADWQFKSWDYPVNLGSGDPGPADGNPDLLVDSFWHVLLYVITGIVDLVACWFEVIYESKFSQSTAGFRQPGTKRVLLVPGRKYGGEWIPPVYGGGDPPSLRRVSAGGGDTEPATVYLTGRGVVDGVGNLTGTANKLIEEPADVANAILMHYGGFGPFQSRAAGIEFGGFGSTRLVLATPTPHRGTFIFDEPATMGKVLDRIANQSLSFIREQIDDNGVPVWRIFTEVADVDTEYPELLYRTTGFGFHWDDFARDTFRASLTAIEDLSSNVRVRFGFHLPSNEWSDEKYCNDHANNFATNGAAYQAAMLSVRNYYHVDNPIVIEAPDIWDPDSAERLCKWACDRLRRRRVLVEFDTFINALDLEPGHVITIDDEIGQRVVWPGDVAGNWSAKRLNVTRVYPRRDEGRPWLVHVRAIETYSRAA